MFVSKLANLEPTKKKPSNTIFLEGGSLLHNSLTMTIHFSKEKWIEIEKCWKKILNNTVISNIINSNVNNIDNNIDNNKLKEDIILMNNLLNSTDNNNKNKTDISNITSFEFNNIMNEIDHSFKKYNYIHIKQ